MNRNIWRILLSVCLHAMHGWETCRPGIVFWRSLYLVLSIPFNQWFLSCYHCSLTRYGCCNRLFVSVAIFTCLVLEWISSQTCNDRRPRNHPQFITETNVLYGQNHTHRFSIKYANVVYKAKIRSKVPQKDAEKLMRTLLTQILGFLQIVICFLDITCFGILKGTSPDYIVTSSYGFAGLMLLYSRGDINQINSCLKTAFPSLLGIKQWSWRCTLIWLKTNYNLQEKTCKCNEGYLYTGISSVP